MKLFQESCCAPRTARTRRDETVMMYVVIIVSIVMMFIGASTGRSAPVGTPAQSESVYICDSPGAKAYHHYRDCKLLGPCKAKVETVKEMSARGKGRDRCDSCNKRLKDGKKS